MTPAELEDIRGRLELSKEAAGGWWNVRHDAGNGNIFTSQDAVALLAEVSACHKHIGRLEHDFDRQEEKNRSYSQCYKREAEAYKEQCYRIMEAVAKVDMAKMRSLLFREVDGKLTLDDPLGRAERAEEEVKKLKNAIHSALERLPIPAEPGGAGTLTIGGCEGFPHSQVSIDRLVILRNMMGGL